MIAVRCPVCGHLLADSSLRPACGHDKAALDTPASDLMPGGLTQTAHPDVPWPQVDTPHKRGIEEFVETVLGVPIAGGTISNLEEEVSEALAAAHRQAREAVQQAPARNVDETSWKRAGLKQWLWGAATALVACFVIAPSRGAAGLAALLGKKIQGIVCSDRWSVYGQLRLGLRQLC